MRKTLMLILCLGLVPWATAANTNPEVTSISVSAGAIDLIADAGTTFTLNVNVTEPDVGDRVEAVEVTFDGPSTFIVNPIAQDTARSKWQATLNVDDVRLLTGTYKATAKAFDRFGGSHTLTVQSVLAVTATTLGTYPLTLGIRDVTKVGGAYPQVDLGLNDALRINAEVTGAAPLLRFVTYHVDVGANTGATLPLERPYVLGQARFTEGASTLHVTAFDRAGRTASIEVPVFKDTLAPVAAVTLPNQTYQAVPFDALVTVTDASDYSVFLSLDNQTVELPSDSDNIVTFTLTRSQLGFANMVITVVDALDNVEVLQHNVTTVQAIANTTVRLSTSPAFPLPGMPVKFEVTVSQKNGVTTIPVDTILWVPGQVTLLAETIDVPIDSQVIRTVQRNFRPGSYEANATVSVGEAINETDPSDQTALVAFEVYLGKVVHGEDAYYIRVDSRGQPIQAVSTGGAQYNLTLNQDSGKALYEFVVKGKTLHWDPSSSDRTTTIEVDEEVEKKEDKGIPGLPVVFLLGALLFAARRK